MLRVAAYWCLLVVDVFYAVVVWLLFGCCLVVVRCSLRVVCCLLCVAWYVQLLLCAVCWQCVGRCCLSSCVACLVVYKLLIGDCCLLCGLC